MAAAAPAGKMPLMATEIVARPYDGHQSQTGGCARPCRGDADDGAALPHHHHHANDHGVHHVNVRAHDRPHYASARAVFARRLAITLQQDR